MSVYPLQRYSGTVFSVSRVCYSSVVTMWRLQFLIFIVVSANAKPEAGVFDPALQVGYADYYNVRIILYF